MTLKTSRTRKNMQFIIYILKLQLITTKGRDDRYYFLISKPHYAYLLDAKFNLSY